MNERPLSAEALLFDFIDQFKFIFFPEQWNQFLLNCSKNDAFVLILAYRRGQVNMTEIADYLNIPLNTVTGIVSRLEKKEMVKRERSASDKRVVTIALTNKGTADIKEAMGQLNSYFTDLMAQLTDEEKRALSSVSLKLLSILKPKPAEKTEKRVRKIQIN
ncbi:MAG: MarR family transcriptional regulator [Eubacterium sp.]